LYVFSLGGGPTVDEWIRGDPTSAPNLAAGEPLYLVFLKVLAFFFLLLLLGWIAFRIARRGKGTFFTNGVDVLFRVSLAPGKYVAALRLGGTVYLLGIGEDVHLLETLAAEEVEGVFSLSEEHSAPSSRLGERFLAEFRAFVTGAAEKPGSEGKTLSSDRERVRASEGEIPSSETEEERRLRDLFRREG